MIIPYLFEHKEIERNKLKKKNLRIAYRWKKSIRLKIRTLIRKFDSQNKNDRRRAIQRRWRRGARVVVVVPPRAQTVRFVGRKWNGRARRTHARTHTRRTAVREPATTVRRCRVLQRSYPDVSTPRRSSREVVISPYSDVLLKKT